MQWNDYIDYRPDDDGGSDDDKGKKTDDDDQGSSKSGSQEDDDGSQGGTGESGSQASASEEVKALRKEAAKYRTERNTARKKVDELEGAGATEIEKVQKKLDTSATAVTELQDTNRVLRVRVISDKVGIIPEARADAAKLLNWDDISDPDDDAAVEKALKSLVKDRPFLLGSSGSGADGGAGGGDKNKGAGSDMNQLLRASAGRS